MLFKLSDENNLRKFDAYLLNFYFGIKDAFNQVLGSLTSSQNTICNVKEQSLIISQPYPEQKGANPSLNKKEGVLIDITKYTENCVKAHTF